jgi:hypothetical protein
MGTGEQDMGTVPLKREENQGEAWDGRAVMQVYSGEEECKQERVNKTRENL